MEFLQAFILGIVEGITEFLPVSSTFHLIWAGKLMGIEHTPFQKLFEVAIQAGAILAVFPPFIKAITHDSSLLKKSIVAFIPTAIIGFLLHPYIKTVFFDNTGLQLFVFAIVGVVFIAFEHIRTTPYARSLSSMTYQHALVIGTFQSLAIIPGVSRAGAVILTLMALSYTREDAARFSFFLAIPTILSASVFDIATSYETINTGTDWGILLIGFLVAFVTSLVIVHWFIHYLSHHTLAVFGWYRLLLTAGFALFFLR